LYFITGGAGFIGSCLVKFLNKMGINDICVVEDRLIGEKWKNLLNLKFNMIMDKAKILAIKPPAGSVIVHLGAYSSTTNTDVDGIFQNNYMYSTELFEWCRKHSVRFIYASSASVYGSLQNFVEDAETEPSSPYALSKVLLDRYVLTAKATPPQWVGLRLFNVFGPNEYHKQNMASFIYHVYQSVSRHSKIILYDVNGQYQKGLQRRDFIYINDVLDVIWYFICNKQFNGIYNVGTGVTTPFLNIVEMVSSLLNKECEISFSQLPPEVSESYQVYTCADLKKLQDIGYKKQFSEISQAVKDYIENYLSVKKMKERFYR